MSIFDNKASVFKIGVFHKLANPLPVFTGGAFLIKRDCMKIKVFQAENPNILESEVNQFLDQLTKSFTIHYSTSINGYNRVTHSCLICYQS